MAVVAEESQITWSDELEHQFSLVSKVELGMALLATLLLAILHVVCFKDNPALWRDEIASLNLASVNSFQKYWELCEFDSSFAAWFLVLRGWISIFGNSDFSLRTLGTGMGLGLLASCWWVARQFNCRNPLVTLSLFSLNSAVLYWGDTVRGYGMGTMLLMIMFGQVWRFAQAPTWKSLLLAFLPALLAVHTLYYNCIFLFAMCMGVVALMIGARNWRGCVQILGLGFVCALTMAVYIDPVRRVGKWRLLVELPLSMRKVIDLFNGSGGYAAYVLDFVWTILLTITPLLLGLLAFLKWRNAEKNQPQRALFLLVTFCFGLGGYIGLLFWHGYQPQPWHFIPILGFVIIPIEIAIMDGVRYSEAGRKLRLYFVVAFWLLVFHSTLVMVEGRRTNVDIAADRVNQEAKPGDLVVIHPWFYGITFRHYNRSPADWVAVPGMRDEDLLVHRYDVQRDMLQKVNPAASLVEEIDAKLKGGHTVWYVGKYLAFEDKKQSIGSAPPPLTSAKFRYGALMHLTYWEKFFVRHFEDHAKSVEDIEVGHHNFFGFENTRLLKISGWQDNPPE